MKAKLNQTPSRLECRKVYTQTLYELMKEHDDIVVLDADLVSASGSQTLFQAYPDRCFNVGISEANMMGVAAGLSLVGLKPYIHTFAPFATRRMYDQVYISGAYQNNNVRIFGSDPGFWAAHNGGTHTSVEDLALMRVIPKMNVIAPADGVALRWAIQESAQQQGMFYIRAPRKDVPTLYDESMTFELGKGVMVLQGQDGVIFTIGEMLNEAMLAAKALSDNYGISLSIVDMVSMKPMDEAIIRHALQGKSFAITAENHSIINGLGSAIAQIIAYDGLAIPLRSVAILDHFGEVGTSDYLQKKYKLTHDDIVDAVLSLTNKGL